MEIEETKAIRYLEWTQSQMRLGNLPPYNQDVYKSIDTLLNRLEQLEKENKEYTVRLTDEQYRKVIEIAQKDIIKDTVPKSVIRDKIEELEKYEKLAKEQIENRIVIADSDSLNYGRAEAHSKDIQILKEILGDE